MKRAFGVIVILHLGILTILAQNIIPTDITIARDDLGVPHIFGQSDNDVAYGLGWVQCEDQFKTLQEILAACKGQYGLIKGKDGAIADIAIQYMLIAEYVEENYEKDVTGQFRSYIESYAAGINAYADRNPDKIILKKLFPVTAKDVLTGYMLGCTEISHAGDDLRKIMNGRIVKDMKSNFPKGSNAFALTGPKTVGDETYLAINSHQPLEGWYSWYEAHLHSEEGLNIIGATFAGGANIFLGANENLGWGHTVNHADFSDVIKLEVNSDQDAYLVDDQWKPLIKKKAKSKIKVLGFIPIPISKTYYKSEFGPTFKTDDGFFAWSFPAGQTLKMAEQWFMMNKAKDLSEFKKALEIRGIVSTNIVYADKEDNIFYISNGSFKDRNPKYEWDEVVPGTSSDIYLSDDELSLADLPQILNPECGWIFNTNNTPFTSSCPEYSAKETKLNKVMGYQKPGDENNRSRRFLELMNEHASVDYETFKTIKYDNQYPQDIERIRGVDVEDLFTMDPKKYMDISKELEIIQNWDRRTNIESKGAALFFASIYNRPKSKKNYKTYEDYLADCVRNGKQHLLDHFGKIDISLGTLQRHRRDGVDLPMPGGPDVLSAIYSEGQKDGRLRPVAGDSYIALVRFSGGKVYLESINAFGTSEVPGDPNSTSQMTKFANYELQQQSFNKKEILKNASKVYHPN